MYKYSSTPRPLDKNYFTNKIIGIAVPVTILAGFVFQIISGAGIIDSLLWGLGGGALVFLTWALCREMDPDNDYSAILAASIALIGVLVFGISGILVMVLYLFSARILIRTTGLKAKPMDSILLLVLGSIVGFFVHPVFFLLIFLIFLFDALLKNPLKLQFLFTGLAIIIIIPGTLLSNYPFEGEFYYFQVLVTGVLTLLFIPVIISSKNVMSTGDVTGNRLIGIRLQTGLILLITTSLLYTAINGEEIHVLYPFWSCVVAILIYRIYKFFQKCFNSR
jgi:hypothetical protein